MVTRVNCKKATNPCPCGFRGDRSHNCVCSGEQISRYQGRVSGPLLDRIDLFVEVNRPKQIVLPGKGQPGERSDEVRERVVAARLIQADRQMTTNAQLDISGVKQHCRLGPDEEKFFEQAAGKLSLSPRGCQRVLKVARTIADMDSVNDIGQTHLAEAIGLRQPERS